MANGGRVSRANGVRSNRQDYIDPLIGPEELIVDALHCLVSEVKQLLHENKRHEHEAVCAAVLLAIKRK